ncbi:hypothetical protein EII17_03655 [Clostridiales bacterium COT073_COT-073]|nr:hypothetical protein EII17_03655 [Clostridiales bacterium COT073_COT-073]
MKKKIITFLMAIIMVIGMAACSNAKTDKSTDSTTEKSSEKSKYTSAEEVLSKVYELYKEDQKFPISGGDSENYVEDKPAAYDITKTEEMDFELGFPASQTENIDAAATMIHMLNANTFTGAAYHLKEGVDAEAFAKAIKEHTWSPNREWLCGAPDTFMVILVDKEYVITVFGKKEITDVFKENALSALEGAKVIIEETASY